MTTLNFVKFMNLTFAVVFALAYFYQTIFLLVGIVKKHHKAEKSPRKIHKFAAIICARNEEGVISEIIGNLKNQKYPKGMLDVFVVADNCSDNTAKCAREAGAFVYERFDKWFVGKGYAMDFLLKKIREFHSDAGYEGFFVFDADNLVDENFAAEMNKAFCKGYDVLTCYRNSKNFGANWISAGYSIWFLRESRFLNFPRTVLGTNCAVSGTGFLVSAKIIEKNNGWPFHLLTEDIEFSAYCTVNNYRIGYCGKAVIYDEQPTSFSQSWDQRLRWSKGFYQVNAKYSIPLAKGVFSGGRAGMSCYDMFMTIAPGMLLMLLMILMNTVVWVACLSEPYYISRRIIQEVVHFITSTGINFYLWLFLYGLLTVVFEWKKINARFYQKIGYLFTFPLFMFTYVPIALVALVQKVQWKPIRHSSMAEIKKCEL